MPLPISLVGLSFVSQSNWGPKDPADRSDVAGTLDRRAELVSRCSRALMRLEEQRDAVNERTIPRVQAVWARVDVENEARAVFHDRLSLSEAPCDTPTSSERSVGEAIGLIAVPESPRDLPAALAEMICLDATTAAATRAVDALARLRLRLYAQCRRLEELAEANKPVSTWTLHERRLLNASARVAGSAASLAQLPAVGRDGGIDRHFVAALRQL
jgi:hypothetical protein